MNILLVVAVVVVSDVEGLEGEQDEQDHQLRRQPSHLTSLGSIPAGDCQSHLGFPSTEDSPPDLLSGPRRGTVVHGGNLHYRTLAG